MGVVHQSIEGTNMQTTYAIPCRFSVTHFNYSSNACCATGVDIRQQRNGGNAMALTSSGLIERRALCRIEHLAKHNVTSTELVKCPVGDARPREAHAVGVSNARSCYIQLPVSEAGQA
jgi:hypothetical protein